MPIVKIEVDTDKAKAIGEKVFRRLMKAEEAHPNSLALHKLHEALEEMQSGLLAKFPPETFEPFSGGGKSGDPGG